MSPKGRCYFKASVPYDHFSTKQILNLIMNKINICMNSTYNEGEIVVSLIWICWSSHVNHVFNISGEVGAALKMSILEPLTLNNSVWISLGNFCSKLVVFFFFFWLYVILRSANLIFLVSCFSPPNVSPWRGEQQLGISGLHRLEIVFSSHFRECSQSSCYFI